MINIWYAIDRSRVWIIRKSTLQSCEVALAVLYMPCVELMIDYPVLFIYCNISKVVLVRSLVVKVFMGLILRATV
jgi:hypothetical protein